MNIKETSSNLQHSYTGHESDSSRNERIIETRLRQQLQTVALFESGVDLPSDMSDGERLLPTPQVVNETALALRSLEAKRATHSGNLGYLRLYLDSARYTGTLELRDVAKKTLANSTLNQVDYAYYSAEIAQLEEATSSNATDVGIFPELDGMLDYIGIHDTDAEPFLRAATADTEGNRNIVAEQAVDFYLQVKEDFMARTKEADTKPENSQLHGIFFSLNKELQTLRELDATDKAAVLFAGKSITADIETIAASIAPEEVEEVVDPAAYFEADESLNKPTPEEILLLAEAGYVVAKKVAAANTVESDETAPAFGESDDIKKMDHVIDAVIDTISRDEAITENPELLGVVGAIQQARTTHTDPRIAAEVLAHYAPRTEYAA